MHGQKYWLGAYLTNEGGKFYHHSHLYPVGWVRDGCLQREESHPMHLRALWPFAYQACGNTARAETTNWLIISPILVTTSFGNFWHKNSNYFQILSSITYEWAAFVFCFASLQIVLLLMTPTVDERKHKVYVYDLFLTILLSLSPSSLLAVIHLSFITVVSPSMGAPFSLTSMACSIIAL